MTCAFRCRPVWEKRPGLRFAVPAGKGRGQRPKSMQKQHCVKALALKSGLLVCSSKSLTLDEGFGFFGNPLCIWTSPSENDSNNALV